MNTTFELWDTESRNLLAVYESEDQALEDIFDAVSQHGPRAVTTLLLGQEDEAGNSSPIASGPALAERAQTWHERTGGNMPVRHR